MLLFGGRSAEHDVSRVTAVAVAKALDPDRYEVVPVGITTDGRWLAEVTGLPVLFWDERYTTVEAEGFLQVAGLTKKKRKARVDRVARREQVPA